MTRLISAVKNCKLAESIQDLITISSKSELKNDSTIRKEKLPDSEKIVHSDKQINDEFGYFNKIER